MGLGTILAYLCEDERDHLYVLGPRQALVARVDSTRTTSLAAQIPPTDDDDVVAGLLALNLMERTD